MLHLSTVGSGTEYCEPSTGTCTKTDLSMADLVEIEEDWQKLLHSKQDVMKKNEKLKRENMTLLSECAFKRMNTRV